MADLQTDIKSQMAAAVAATVANPNVQAEESAIPALINALGPVIDAIVHSTNNEPFYQSRVFWGSTVAIVSTLLAPFHVDLPLAMQGEITNDIVLAIPIGASLYALYGRFRAKKPLGS
jgi:hypothetical protein